MSNYVFKNTYFKPNLYSPLPISSVCLGCKKYENELN